MNSKWLKIVNPLLALSLLAVIIILVLLKTGDGGAAVREAHEIAGIILVALLALHIFLNRKWFKTLRKK